VPSQNLVELVARRRLAKERANWQLGLRVSNEILALRKDFGDWCWLAWFEEKCGNYQAALKAIKYARLQNPEEVRAKQFERELMERFANVGAVKMGNDDENQTAMNPKARAPAIKSKPASPSYAVGHTPAEILANSARERELLGVSRGSGRRSSSTTEAKSEGNRTQRYVMKTLPMAKLDGGEFYDLYEVSDTLTGESWRFESRSEAMMFARDKE
jgi:hypothetical protein